jgi:hypothetical protein
MTLYWATMNKKPALTGWLFSLFYMSTFSGQDHLIIHTRFVLEKNKPKRGRANLIL